MIKFCKGTMTEKGINKQINKGQNTEQVSTVG